MYAAGARVFVEAGPGKVLTRLVDEVLGDRPHLAVATDGRLLHALGELACAGVPVDPAALFWDRDAALVDLDAEPAKPATWLVNGHAAWPVASSGAPVKPPPLQLVPRWRSRARPARRRRLAERDGVLIEYLRGMRSMITAQRDVMLAYLGAQPVARVADVADRGASSTCARGGRSRRRAPGRARRGAGAGGEAVPVAAAARTRSDAARHLDRQRAAPVIRSRTLGVDLDLEADLNIDSIKRIEIIGELALKLGLRIE